MVLESLPAGLVGDANPSRPPANGVGLDCTTTTTSHSAPALRSCSTAAFTRWLMPFCGHESAYRRASREFAQGVGAGAGLRSRQRGEGSEGAHLILVFGAAHEDDVQEGLAAPVVGVGRRTERQLVWHHLIRQHERSRQLLRHRGAAVSVPKPSCPLSARSPFNRR